ncbi:MAG: patatin-like phospholipase family protein, partial [Bacteroidales bacterium]|nr:patatin-like phospholipase family protein [Bacteroidales bacterium]
MKEIRKNKIIFLLMLLIGLFSFYHSEAQDANKSATSVKKRPRPKVGVVLCGGGAKGFSQIPILKAIDEAGIPIDYIGGTSIGSIMGALYAIGYDPDVMEQLVRNQDWNKVIYDRIPPVLMPVEQKMYERQYLATFPILNNKLKVKSSLVDGVYVNLLMSKLMLPASNVHDFNKLPVPFYCIATDVEHACQYEMTEGNLARSVRASMSIPFFFKPVVMDDKLLIDGGMVNNFPVRNMKERGADIIIGVDLEDATIPASQIDNSLGLLESMMNLSSLEESNYARKNCDIYIRPNLHGRNMLSFNDFDSIIKFGEEAANEFAPQLKTLATFLEEFEPIEINRPHLQPVDTLRVVDVQVEGIANKHKASVRREFGKRFPKMMTVDDIQEVVLKLYASGYYEDLWYEMTDDPEGIILQLHCKEKEDRSLAVCIHYDNNYGIGALVNFTMKNLWQTMNRTTMSLDVNIAENPYVRANINKRQGRVFRFGADLSAMSLKMNQYDDNRITNSYSMQSNTLDLNVQLVPSLTQQIRLGAVIDYVHMKDLVGDDGLGSDYSLYTYMYFNYFFSNEDVPNFARRGWRINLKGKAVYFDGLSYMVNGSIVKAFPLGKRNSLKFGVEAGTKIGGAEVPLFYQFMIGGQSKMKYYDNIKAFTGMNFIEKVVDHIAIGRVAWQWRFYKNFYSTVNFDCGYMTDMY